MIAGIVSHVHARQRLRDPKLVTVRFVAGYGLGFGAVKIGGGKSDQDEDRQETEDWS
jgi:hypothetical protein